MKKLILLLFLISSISYSQSVWGTRNPYADSVWFKHLLLQGEYDSTGVNLYSDTSGQLNIWSDYDGNMKVKVWGDLYFTNLFSDDGGNTWTIPFLGSNAGFNFLTLGDSGKFLMSNGTSSNPSFQSPPLNTTPSDTVKMDTLGTPTYKTLKDWFNTIQSSGRISGMTLTAHSPADGTLDISSGTGIIKTTNAVNGSTRFFNYGGGTVALTDSNLNYIYMDYDAGKLTVKATTDRSTIHDYDQFPIGRCYREGNDAGDITSSGVNIFSSHRRIHNMLVKKYGFAWASGSTTSESGNRNIAVTEGTWYIGATEITTPTFTADTIETYYYNGTAWVRLDTTTLSNTQYNNVASGLTSLGTSKYMNHWIYECPAGGIYAVWGQAQYNSLAEAQATSSPSTVPNYISKNTRLIARITLKQGATNFAAISNTLITPVSMTSVATHNNLGGLQGGTTDQYYHLTEPQHTAYSDTTKWLRTSETYDTLSRTVNFSLISAADSANIWQRVPHNVVVDSIFAMRQGGTSDSIMVVKKANGSAGTRTALLAAPYSVGTTSASAGSVQNGTLTAMDDLWVIVSNITGEQTVNVTIRYHRRLK